MFRQRLIYLGKIKNAPFLFAQISYSPTRRGLLTKSSHFTLCGNVAPVHLQTVRRSFLTSAFVIKLSWGFERYVQREKLATKLPRALRQSSLRKPQRGAKEDGDGKPSKRNRQRRKEMKRKKRCIPTQIQGTRNLARQSAAGTKKVPFARTNACPPSLCIFDTYSVSIHDVWSVVLFICDSPDVL